MPDPTHPTADLTAPVFLSYSRRDRDLVIALQNELQAADVPLWRDIHDIPAGSPHWWGEIRAAIDGCSSMVLCLSLPALQSTVVSDEWNYAQRQGKRIIPVIVDEVFAHPDVLAGTVVVPVWMRNANWLDLRPDAPERVAAFANLLKTLRTPYTPCPVHVTVKASQLPHNFVPRPREFEPLVRALAVDSPPDAVALTAALRGAGGYGKTTLAKALCRDWRVSGAFPDGIHWVTLGEKLLTMSYDVREGELVARILNLVRDIAPEQPLPPFPKLDAAQEELARAVAGRRCLIVVDDAWAEAHVRPFLVPGKHHATVITTRFDECIPRGVGVVRQPIDEMAGPDALALLAFGIENWQAERAWFAATAERLGRSSQLLGIINGAITERLAPDDRGRVKTLRAALDDVDERLDYYGVTAFDAEDPEQREQTFGRTLEVGIERLKPDEQQRYRALGIFPEDVPIPLTTLAALWGLKRLPVRDFCEKLAKSSLVQDYDERALSLHDVTLTYLAQTLPDAPAVHARLVEAWGDPHTLPDDYAWRFYGYHLQEAGRLADLRALLLDFAFLQAKLDATGLNALLADCDRFPGDRPIRLLRQALTLSANVVAREKRLLAGQILERLRATADESGLARLRAGVRDENPLRLINPAPALTQAGGNTLAVFQGHTGPVSGALALTNGSLLSWAGGPFSTDHTLCRWDLNGQLLAVFEGHTDAVRGALALADGSLLSWAEDGTLRRWDLNGQLLAVFEGHTDAVRGALALADGSLLSWAGGYMSTDHTLRRWDLNGQLLAVFEGHTGIVLGVLALADGSLLSWSSDYTLRRWDPNGQTLAVFAGHTNNVYGALALVD
ncbi:MAG: TIR domain-containing protein, partial [Chloroflexi bacterium]|nr:TIR domain-containing protein [Chloroflexota bacterium]